MGNELCSETQVLCHTKVTQLTKPPSGISFVSHHQVHESSYEGVSIHQLRGNEFQFSCKFGREFALEESHWHQHGLKTAQS